jgi:hypothetical protein
MINKIDFQVDLFCPNNILQKKREKKQKIQKKLYIYSATDKYINNILEVNYSYYIYY